MQVQNVGLTFEACSVTVEVDQVILGFAVPSSEVTCSSKQRDEILTSTCLQLVAGRSWYTCTGTCHSVMSA